VFDTELLAGRLAAATDWLRDQLHTPGVPVGYFGASTGAAAALWAAADPGARIAAVVSRGGRPDLAGPRLAAVVAPTLLIVGGRDPMVLGLNREAQARLRCESRLSVVPGATHLFEEPGALQRVAELARDWFIGHMAAAVRSLAGR
jgi:putative phosphoribosyl transferase